MLDFRYWENSNLKYTIQKYSRTRQSNFVYHHHHQIMSNQAQFDNNKSLIICVKYMQ